MLEDILGINRRNIDLVMSLNRRADFKLVDDKLVSKELMHRHGIPNPELLGTMSSLFELEAFDSSLLKHHGFVVKPARGSGGGGILVVRDVVDEHWVLASAQRWDADRRKEHLNDILYGVYSLDNSPDSALAEELVVTHEDLAVFSREGVPDIRIILYYGKPACAMLRVPTRQSGGKANLHAGGFAVGIDMHRGVTLPGWYRSRSISCHPETGEKLKGRVIPGWNEMYAIASRLRDIFPLDYMGADFVMDSRRGPLVLELNARPGLEIQNVCGTGLLKVLERLRDT